MKIEGDSKEIEGWRDVIIFWKIYFKMIMSFYFVVRFVEVGGWKLLGEWLSFDRYLEVIFSWILSNKLGICLKIWRGFYRYIGL